MSSSIWMTDPAGMLGLGGRHACPIGGSGGGRSGQAARERLQGMGLPIGAPTLPGSVAGRDGGATEVFLASDNSTTLGIPLSRSPLS